MSGNLQDQWAAPITELSEFRDRTRRIEQPFQNIPRPDGQLFAVLGGAGMGKTSLLNVLPKWLQGKQVRGERRLVPALIHYTPDDLTDPTAFLLRLIKQLREGLRTLGLCTISEQNFEPYFAGLSPTDGFHAAFNFLLGEANRASTKTGGSLANVRLIGLIDDAETLAHLHWAPDFFRSLWALYAGYSSVHTYLDLVLAGGDCLARHFDRESPLEKQERVYLGPMPQEVVLGWLQEISEGRIPPQIAEEIVVESGGQPALVRYFVREIQDWTERRGGWDRLPQDVLERIASGFLQDRAPMLSACLSALQQEGCGSTSWSACRLLVQAGDKGLDKNAIDDQLWEELKTKIDINRTLDHLVWQGAALPVPGDTGLERYVTGRVFRRYFEQYHDRPLPAGPPAPRIQWTFEYNDLALRLSAEGDQYRVRVTSPLYGEGSSTFHASFPASEIDWQNVIEQPNAAAQVQELGKRLFDAILNGTVLTVFRCAQRTCWQENRGLRLKLIIEPAELHSLPWEFLYDQEGRHRFLTLSWETPLVRYVESPTPVPEFRAVDKVYMLVVAASPTILPELDLNSEVNNIRAALDPCRAQGWLDYRIVQGEEASSDHLQDILRQQMYHVFHFLGHGGFDRDEQEGLVWLEGADRRGERLTARRLATLLGDEADIRLVFLNACQTASGSEITPFTSVAGTLVRAGIPAVVATQQAISNAAATLFSRGFYRALAAFYPLERAVAEGRKAIDVSAKSYEWVVPVLYLRAQDGYVFRQG